MKKLIILLITPFLFSQELKVEGDLKVTGEIDAQGQTIKNVGTPLAVTDALNLQTLNNMMTDDGVYEYKFIAVKFEIAKRSSDGYYETAAFSVELGGDFETTAVDWTTELNNLEAEGWKINMVFPIANYSEGSWSDLKIGMFMYQLKKPLEEE